MASQPCPNCQTVHDTKVYVTGQKLLCRCGIRFEVKRNDASMFGRRPSVIPRADGAAANVTAVGGAALNLVATPLPKNTAANDVSGAMESVEPRAAAPAPPDVARSPVGALVPLSAAATPHPAAGEQVTASAPAGEVAAGSSVVAASPGAAPDDPRDTGAPPIVSAAPFAATAIRTPAERPAQPVLSDAVGSSAKTARLPRPPNASDSNPTVIRAVNTGPEIPGYQLLDILGRGGMGEVWRAKQVSLDRMVAVKVLPEQLASDREFVARFEKEAQALASLSHPNIIQIIDRGVVGSNYYFVMEFVAGRSLREVMAEGNLEPVEALRIIAQICRAIDYAHDRGIIHRDLKPENILLDERGHVKVADFGLAGFVERSGDNGNLTATSVAMGTLNYMAPEQRRDAKSVDGRADLFSLGVILYELLTGELPLGRFKLPSERGNLDARLDRIIVRALETDPDARYPRASHIGAELDALISGAGTWPAAPAPKAPSVLPQVSVIQKGWSGIRYGLTLIGALTLIAFLLRGPFDSLWPSGRGSRTARVEKNGFPPNSDSKIAASARAKETNGYLSFDSTFDAPESDDAKQVFNANDGWWKIEGGKLIALQAGNEATKTTLRPRAYMSRRYFTSDDFSAEVKMSYRSLKGEYPIGQDAQVFEELSFRIADSVTVSVFAIPGKGVRLLWAYTTVDGIEVIGNSAQDPNSMLDDEIPPPPDGVPFTVKLTLKAQKEGTLAEAFLNGHRVGRKMLVGLKDTTGKLAVGCRNLRCEFDDLKIRGRAMARPKRSVAQND